MCGVHSGVWARKVSTCPWEPTLTPCCCCEEQHKAPDPWDVLLPLLEGQELR